MYYFSTWIKMWHTKFSISRNEIVLNFYLLKSIFRAEKVYATIGKQIHQIY